MNRQSEYRRLKDLVAGETLPAMLVDLDVLEANGRRLAEVAAAKGKTIRIATKSLRVPDLIRKVMEAAPEIYRGLMCYSAREAQVLADAGFDDLLVAYPTVQTADLDAAWELTCAGRTIALMVDGKAHLERLEKFWTARCSATGVDRPLKVCIDIDVSWRPCGGLIHLGVQRSPIRRLKDLQELVADLQGRSCLELHALMAYEAQIAGVPDASPFGRLLNPVIRLIKRLSIRDVARRRREISEWLESSGTPISYFNGGGTGSLRSTAEEPWISEVASGSGLLQSHLFDYYRDNINQPAFTFALQVARYAGPGVIVCQNGGYIASGETGLDKSPVPYLPHPMKTFAHEGYGEVQTPLQNLSGTVLEIGDPVFFRPAKAGEIAERFTEYLMVRKDNVVGRAATYRGRGLCFG